MDKQKKFKKTKLACFITEAVWSYGFRRYQIVTLLGLVQGTILSSCRGFILSWKVNGVFALAVYIQWKILGKKVYTKDY